MFDVAYARGQYTSLSDGWTYLNAHIQAQIPERVGSAVSTAFRTSALVDVRSPATGSHANSSELHQTIGESHLAAARSAIADLVGASPDRVVLGPNKQILIQSLVTALQPRLRRTTQIVLNRIDPESTTAPFMQSEASAVWAEPDLGTGELPAWQYDEVVNGSTRLVVVPAAHSLIGTVIDVAAISEIVRAKSRAWMFVDASALAPYRAISIDEWGADIVAVEFAPMGGPQMAALVFRDTSMFPLLKAVNVEADSGKAGKLELGALSTGLAGGLTSLVEHYAGFATTGGTRASRLQQSMAEVDRYCRQLTRHLINSLVGLPTVHVLGVSGEAAGKDAIYLDRVPRVTFMVPGVPAVTVQRRLLTNGLVTDLCPHDPLLEAMGAFEEGGAITIGLAAYNTMNDVDQLTRVLASLA
ncbi:Cysteine desulfurase [Corynebacterium kalinowskii]|uniref:Cysteine desulfurase n=1 Tax=Corynebacterium kalinowskii TaxID=2675216 RepID=A0A6B8VUY4_9CORY|nr:aminotransferase class V-fold PLP-dependent enzyme [Corynebacterium kalinowskii]QGU01090.1 Cysteine desulfurase [Corynebacterium kalinowskii]